MAHSGFEAPPTDPPADLRRRIRADAENRPGVYRFTGPRGELLYVGKSVRIRERLLSYLRAREGKAWELTRVARAVEWEYVPNEFEALLREFRLIRAFRPRYNVHHRRDRHFAWVKVTREPAPRLVATREPRPDGSRYFGPFPARRSLPRALRDLARVVGLRDCSASTPMHFDDQIDLLPLVRTPLCVRAELGSCPAPCAALCSRDQYLQRVAMAVRFLSGESEEPLEILCRRMKVSARRRDFEAAARHRDREERIRSIREEIVDSRAYLESLTFVYRIPGADGSARSYLLRQGRVRLTFTEPKSDATEARADLARAAREVMSRPDTPPELLDPASREELFLVARWFRRNPDELTRRTAPVGTLFSAPGAPACE
jgi:excinuclease ABC subunit C